ncbi:MAG: energy-coupling factor transporter ATPase [Clostridia bacterium]|nr:energy-coupling factor transporter ATPase [Clostridia bacterium]
MEQAIIIGHSSPEVGAEVQISVQDVYFEYESMDETPPKEVLHGITLDIRRGEFVALLGHNGSGKSTIAKHMNAILLPSGGKVYVDGMDTTDEALLTDIRRTVGMVFQNPDNQLVATIVEEDVAFGPENLGVPSAEMRQLVDDALKAVGMYEYRRHAPHKLSGGQKQRVAIAGIIAMRPECIVFDEPTAMLDPRGRQEVMDAIDNLVNKLGITVVLITHYMDEAARADRVIIINDGKLLMEGRPKEVFSHIDMLREHHLDVPQATELAQYLRSQGYDIPDDVLTPEECARAILKAADRK